MRLDEVAAKMIVDSQFIAASTSTPPLDRLRADYTPYGDHFAKFWPRMMPTAMLHNLAS